MIYEIQPAIDCENCIVCGRRPVIEQTKKDWRVQCPNKACNNRVIGPIADILQWNRKNKPDVDFKPSALKHTA